MDKDGSWCWFSTKPYKREGVWLWTKDLGYRSLTRAFKIKPFDGDWKDSLIKIDHFHQQGKMVKEKEHIIHIEDFPPPPHPTGFMSESQLKRMFEHKEEE